MTTNDPLAERPDETWTARWLRLGFHVEWSDVYRAYVVRSRYTDVSDFKAFKTVQQVEAFVRKEQKKEG